MLHHNKVMEGDCEPLGASRKDTGTSPYQTFPESGYKCWVWEKFGPGRCMYSLTLSLSLGGGSSVPARPFLEFPALHPGKKWRIVLLQMLGFPPLFF